MTLPPAYGGAGLISFSTDEQLVPGVTWIDGKQVYQKTVDFGGLPNDAEKTVAHGIVGLDTVIDFWGEASNGTSVWIPLPYTSPGGLTFQIRAENDATNIIVRPGSDRTSLTESHFTLLYTKT